MGSGFLYVAGGLALILSGGAYLADTLLDILVPGNRFGIGLLVPLSGLLGMTAVFFFQNDNGRLLGFIAFLLNFLGLAGLVAVAFLNNLVLPDLPPEMVGRIMAGRTLGFFIAVGVVFLAGALLMAVTVWRAGKFPRPTAVIYGLAAIPVALPPVFPSAATELGGAAIGAVLVIWGLTLVRWPAVAGRYAL
jgi:hypothetical protein